MHICLVTPSFPPMVDGGVAIATGRLAAGLTHRGHRVTVLTAPPSDNLGPPEMALGPEALSIVYHDVSEPWHQSGQLAELCDRIGHRHAQQPFDMILAYFIYPSGYLAVRLGDRLGLPVVCSCRGNDISKDMFIAPDILETVLRQSTQLIFVSTSLLKMADTLVPCRHKASVVANSVDCTQFSPAAAPPASPSGAVVIGTSGLMRWKKGIDLLLPLIIRYPECFPRGERIASHVQLTDVFPTILDALRLDVPEVRIELQGMSLLEEQTEAEDRFAYAEMLAPHPAIPALNRRAGLPEDTPQPRHDRSLRCIRTLDSKFIWASDGQHALYDLRRDPSETTNLYPEEPEAAAVLEKHLMSWQPPAGLPLSAPEVHMDEDVRQRLRDLGYID